MNCKSVLSVDEIIHTLNKTSLPTVVIEGKTDVIVYRKLEELWASLNLSILPAGGRANVLKVFQRRNELKKPESVAYIVDRDEWMDPEVPAEFLCKRLLITAGYSIENEIICDGEVLQLMTPDERERFNLELKHFVKWYALVFHRNRLGKPNVKYDLHPDHIFNGGMIKPELIQLEDDEQYPNELHDELIKRYLTHIRGKSLLNLMLRQLSYAGREPRHNDTQIIESVKARPGNLVQAIYNKIGDLYK